MNIFYTTIQGLLYGLLIPFTLDNLIAKHFIIEKARYFFLHVFLNAWITYIVFNDAMNLILNPESGLDIDYSYSAIISTSAISSFHMYHYLCFTNLSFDDYIHHLVSCLIVPAIGIILPTGRLPSLCNLGMCGIPGGIDYLLLFLVKYNIIDKLTEKNINRWLNLVIRWPIMYTMTYIFFLNINKINFYFYKILCSIGAFLHVFNAIYYCEKVIGNYHVSLIKN